MKFNDHTFTMKPTVELSDRYDDEKSAERRKNKRSLALSAAHLGFPSVASRAEVRVDVGLLGGHLQRFWWRLVVW